MWSLEGYTECKLHTHCTTGATNCWILSQKAVEVSEWTTEWEMFSTWWIVDVDVLQVFTTSSQLSSTCQTRSLIYERLLSSIYWLHIQIHFIKYYQYLLFFSIQFSIQVLKYDFLWIYFYNRTFLTLLNYHHLWICCKCTFSHCFTTLLCILL